jgi:hypothetical protein
VHACGAPGASQAVIDDGVTFVNVRSNSGDPPLNATPVATTVVACPVWQHGPVAGAPVTEPPS